MPKIKDIDKSTFNEEQQRNQFRQQSRSNSRSTDTKSFHREDSYRGINSEPNGNGKYNRKYS